MSRALDVSRALPGDETAGPNVKGDLALACSNNITLGIILNCSNVNSIRFMVGPEDWNYVWCSAGKPINIDFAKWTVNSDVYFLGTPPDVTPIGSSGYNLIALASADDLPVPPPEGFLLLVR